jgi:hypothetical protein
LSINIVDASTGADLGAMDLGTIATLGSGLFPLNMIAVGDDGAIYAANLAVTSSSQLRIYTWENELSAPQGAFAGTPTANAARLGDTLDARGSGGSTQLLLGIAAGSLSRGYVVVSTAGGAPYGASEVTFSSNPPAEGDHHLGITFMEGNTVIGTRGGLRNFTDVNPSRVTSFLGVTGTLIASPVLTSQGERPMDFAMIAGLPILATVDTFSSLVRLYDMTDPDSPVLLDALANTSGASNLNGNGVGQVRFGAILGNTATLYALNTNNGIQAFNVFVPEPTGLALIAISGMCLIRRRRHLPCASICFQESA